MRRLAIFLVAIVASLPIASARIEASGTTSRSDSMFIVGKLIIPRLNIKTTIYKGVNNRQFDRGIGFCPGSAGPGTRGNLVLGGHRTAAIRPFYYIEKMKIGDEITVIRPGKTFVYKVTKVFVVKPTDVWIVNSSRSAILTIFTCHPRGSTAKRYVVRATLVR